MHLLFSLTFFSIVLHDYLSCFLVFNYHACLILTYGLVGSPCHAQLSNINGYHAACWTTACTLPMVNCSSFYIVCRATIRQPCKNIITTRMTVKSLQVALQQLPISFFGNRTFDAYICSLGYVGRTICGPMLILTYTIFVFLLDRETFL